jgi:uncharacterized membrane protein YoaK (UPF0700 family)
MSPSNTASQSNPLANALLLATTGGMLDAVVYLEHGHVFANAMTGNVIFLGIAAFGRHWDEIIPHLVPLGGFFAGVTASKHMRVRLGESSVMLLGLAAEALALFALGWLPSNFPHMAFTAIIAFVSAFQVASYRRVERFSYNSTFVTGNFRDVAEGFYDATSRAGTPETREKGRAQAIDLSLICLCFLVGAILGAWAGPRFGNHALWLAEPLLLTAAVRSLLHGSSLSPSQKE